MELVSLFCFGANAGDGGMDPELFAMFMSYVIEGSSKTKDFSPFPEHGIDATPVVRSFLLQQLLRTGLVKNRGTIDFVRCNVSAKFWSYDLCLDPKRHDRTLFLWNLRIEKT